MLSESCKTCGAPLFEVNGKKICVVCAESDAGTAVSAVQPVAQTKNTENIRVIVPEYAKSSDACDSSQTEIVNSLDTLITEFCRRAHEETDTAKCLTLMECIRTAAEAKVMLNRK